MSIFVIKIIACITMVFDHVKYAIPSLENFITLYFGRIAFPLFAFCAVEGYVHTKDLNKYIKRLFIAGIISQIPFMLFISIFSNEILTLNIMFTLLLGILSLKYYDMTKNKIAQILGVIGIGFLGEYLNVDYGFFGVFLVFVLYFFRDNKIKKFLAFVILVFVHYIVMCKTIDIFIEYKYWKSAIFTSIPIFIMLLYNGQLGKKVQKFYYWFYPVHLMILYLIGIL